MLAEAALLLPVAALAIRMAPFPRTIAVGTVRLGRPSATDVGVISRTVAAVARRMPFRALCFEQGLTVQRMLRSRGHAASLHYGISPGEPLEAHVWVSLHGEIVCGGEQAPRFAEVGRWP